MSIFSLLGNVEKQPQARLQQMANQPGPDQLRALAAQSELIARQRGRAQPSPTGLPALPTGRAVPQQYAGGGIVAFQSGGQSRDPTQGQPGDWNAAEQAQWMRYLKAIGSGAMPIGAAAMDVATAVPRGLMGAGNALIGGARAAGAPVPYMKDILAPEGSKFESATPWYDKYARTPDGAPPPANGPMQQATYSNEPSRALLDMNRAYQQQPPAPAGGGRGGSGVAGLVARKPGDGYPEWTDPRKDAPSRRMSDAEFDAELAKQKARLEQMYGPDVAAEIIAEIKSERDGMKKKYDTNKNEALIQAGAAMMSGRSQHGLINIGDGITKGLGSFKEGRDRLDTQDQALRREGNAAKMQQQARNMQIAGQAIGRTDDVNKDRAAERSEAIAVAKDRFEAQVGKANFGLKEQALDIEMAKVKVDMDRNGILRDGSKMDVVARISQQAQENALKIIEEEATKNVMSPWAKMSPQERFTASQVMAKRWIDNNIGVQSITGRAGAMPSRVQW